MRQFTLAHAAPAAIIHEKECKNMMQSQNLIRVTRRGRTLLLVLALCGTTTLVSGAKPDPQPGEEGAYGARAAGITLPAPPPKRQPSDGHGPHDLLIIENVMLVDGEGAPPRGPVDIQIRQDTIVSIQAPGSAAKLEATVASSARRIDGNGMYALPGLIDAHTHIGSPLQGKAGPITPAEYVFKLWLAHGITTVREVGALNGLAWTVEQRTRSAANAITAPRIVVHARFPGEQIVTEAAARSWVRAVKRAGADGVKLRGSTKAAATGVYLETQKLGMGTSNHHDQRGVYHTNVLDSARQGLDSMEHWYGLPEALFTERRIQDYPSGYNYSDEQWRFGQAGRLWEQAAPPGSPHWNAVRDELVALDFTIVPTLTIYEANRDVARARDASWHDDYTWPALRTFFQPNPELHGSYHFDWTTADEVAWRGNFRRWMAFLNDYKNAGGRVAVGSDAGFIYKLFGFAYIRELELLQEAGFHPLEVLQAATLNGAELLGMADQIGSILPGKKADLVLVEEDPIANFKVLYGTGHMRLNRATEQLEQVGGVRYTIKDGVVFDAKKLLQDVREMVAQAKARQEN